MLQYIKIRRNIHIKKRILASILLACTAFTTTLFTCNVAHASGDYSLSTFTTAYGSSVPIAYLQVADADEDYPQLTNFSGAIRVGSGSKKYNCFTYAMIFCGNVNNISQNTNEEIFTVENATNLILNNPCLSKISFNEASSQDLVMYKILGNPTEYQPANTYNHAALLYEKGSTLESTVVISKWGINAIYRHNLADNPYMGSSYVSQAIQPPIERIIEISFYRVSHNYTYSIKYANSMAIRPISDYHKAICSGCGAFHYEPHTYINKNNYIVCKDCGYNTNYMVNSIVPEKV